MGGVWVRYSDLGGSLHFKSNYAGVLLSLPPNRVGSPVAELAGLDLGCKSVSLRF